MITMTGRVRVGEIDIAYQSLGPTRRPTILLVMGLANQLISWPDGFCRLLVEGGYHVVRFDNRDVGESTHLRHAGTPSLLPLLVGRKPKPAYLVDDMADDTAGLLDALGVGSAHVVGVSMGGMIAQAVAVRHPRRVRSLTSMMSTPGTHVGRARTRARAALLTPPATSREGAAQRSLKIYRTIGSPGFPLDERQVMDVARRSWDRGHDPGGVARQIAAIANSPDRTPGLRGVRVPTLVIHGADDPLVGVDGGRATAAAVPGAELLVVPGMGHNLPRPLWAPIATAITDLARRTDGRSAGADG